MMNVISMAIPSKPSYHKAKYKVTYIYFFHTNDIDYTLYTHYLLYQLSNEIFAYEIVGLFFQWLL